MIPLLYLVVFGEGAVALLLVLRIGPLRDLVMKLLDQLKTGKGPATVKTLGCTMSVILLSSVGSIVRIQNKGTKLGTVTPMDQVLWRTHLLEATLIGFTLFMAFIIDRLHHYIQKLGMLKKSVIAYRKDVEKFQQQEKTLTKEDTKALSEIKSLKEEIADLNGKLQSLKTESDVIEKRRVDAETHVTALQHQSQDLLLEYDRLLEDNQILQKKLLSIG
ncbi:B-cell receptor-associated protein 31-like containing protein [Zostera marina]|uniref:Endoplasmic reticulum transmembrane protein n=1 Tax=Zostera marina TaxID=29655 RepID=A0A0K9PCV6_ZOSMR|nr:B-cell receptor-associated protein 31-like containing protein [Zostera marina]